MSFASAGNHLQKLCKCSISKFTLKLFSSDMERDERFQNLKNSFLAKEIAEFNRHNKEYYSDDDEEWLNSFLLYLFVLINTCFYFH